MARNYIGGGKSGNTSKRVTRKKTSSSRRSGIKQFSKR